LHENTDSKFPADAGFVRDKALMTAAMVAVKIKKYTLYKLHLGAFACLSPVKCRIVGEASAKHRHLTASQTGTKCLRLHHHDRK
jgi:hypothetical protein